MWAETYPHREADARQFLDFETESHDVYWYRDRRDGHQYGMPNLNLVRRHNSKLARTQAVDAKRWTYALRWVGIYLVLSVGLLAAIGPVVVYSWMALPFIALWLGRKRRKAAEVDYMKITDARFDEFLSDQEKAERRNALIVTGAVIGGHEAVNALAAASTGRRTASGSSGGEEYDHGRLHDLVAKGGFSSHPARGDAPSSGFMASYHAPEGSGLATVHDLKDVTPEHIAAHREVASEHLAKPDSYQGGWLDRAENKVYLDASRHFKDEGDVRKFAVQQKQKAYFDLHDFSEKYLHPKLDPDAMKDEGAWKQKYAHLPEPERADPPEGYHSFSHLYPATDEQKSHWAARGEKLAAKQSVPKKETSMAGRPVALRSTARTRGVRPMSDDDDHPWI